jgi:hypothetical protein
VCLAVCDPTSAMVQAITLAKTTTLVVRSAGFIPTPIPRALAKGQHSAIREHAGCNVYEEVRRYCRTEAELSGPT